MYFILFLDNELFALLESIVEQPTIIEAKCCILIRAPRIELLNLLGIVHWKTWIEKVQQVSNLR